MVERCHRTLKAAITCYSSKEWVDVLPEVLLGLRSCIKEDLNAYTAQLLYGKTLRIPGKYFDNIDMSADPKFFVEPLRTFMQNLSVHTSHHYKKKCFVHKDLYTCSHVFLTDDSVKRPLEPPYNGPFRILRRISDRVFEIEIEGKQSTVSVDRLKPAFFPFTELQLPFSSTIPIKVPSTKNTLNDVQKSKNDDNTNLKDNNDNNTNLDNYTNIKT